MTSPGTTLGSSEAATWPHARGTPQREDVGRLMSDNEAAATEPTVEAVALVDIDGDGVVDAVVTQDSAGETVSYVDVDGDGTVDVVIAESQDGSTVVAIDEDGDGTPDVLLVDVDGDGTIDAIATLDENGEVVDVYEVVEEDAPAAE